MSRPRPDQLSSRPGSTPATKGSSGGVGDPARVAIEVLIGVVALMWVIELINTIDNNALDKDGIHARDVGRLWGIFTAPFLHASFAHLISNTIPFIFMGVIIALRGVREFLWVTVIVIVVGGLGTWLIAPAHTSTIGASGVVFGYAAYLLTSGLFNRSALELVVGLVVAVVWGGALLASLVPHYGVSWQAHVCGAVAGVLAAWLLARDRPKRGASSGSGSGSGGGSAGGGSGAGGMSALDRALSS
jgi:membrane associated rhomboid family serine protease